MGKSRTAGLSRSVLVSALVVLVLALSSCAKARLAGEDEKSPLNDGDVAGDPLDEPSPSEALGEVTEDDDPSPAAIDEPEPVVGSTITVTGTVDEVVDENAFEVAVQGRSGAGFLVLLPDDDVDVGDIVEVTGTVREPDFDQLRAELDFEVDRDLYSQSDRQRVIVAESVEVVGQGVG